MLVRPPCLFDDVDIDIAAGTVASTRNEEARLKEQVLAKVRCVFMVCSGSRAAVFPLASRQGIP